MASGVILSAMKETVVVTGASGFLGSWLCNHLSSIGFKVSALTRSSESLSRLSLLPKSMIFEHSELEWPNLIRDLRPDILISADWSGVVSLDRNSKMIQIANLDRVQSLAEAAIQSRVKTFITFGSQAENGPINKPAEEVNYDRATTSYGQTKIELRKILNEKFKQTETRFVWGRIFSTYGALDNPNWLLPSLINSLHVGKSFSLTSGEQIWSYLHAYDFCLAIDCIIRHNSIEGIVNIGNETTKTIREFVSYVGNVMRKQSLLEFGNSEYRNDQVMVLQPKTTKLNSVGWKPTIEHNDGLVDLVNWHVKGECKFSFKNLYYVNN